MTARDDDTLTAGQLAAIEKKYDTALATRDNGPLLSRALYAVSIAFALYHVYTAGFGTPVDYLHMGIHLAGLFILIFAGFPFLRTAYSLVRKPDRWWRFGSVPLHDWVFMALGVAAALFLTLSWRGLTVFGYAIPEQALRQGDPSDRKSVV